MARWHLGTLALCVVALASSSCSGCRRDDPETARIKATTLPTYDTKTGKLSRLTADLNQNGKIDTWTYMDAAKILRTERDRNEDGMNAPMAPPGTASRARRRSARASHLP